MQLVGIIRKKHFNNRRMARERNNKEVKTHLSMVTIYDKFAVDFRDKHGIDLTYTEVSEKIADKIVSVGGVKV